MPRDLVNLKVWRKKWFLKNKKKAYKSSRKYYRNLRADPKRWVKSSWATYRLEHITKGLCCNCPNPVRKGSRLCQPCYTRKGKERKALIKAGLCVLCRKRKAQKPLRNCKRCRLFMSSSKLLIRTLTAWVYGNKCVCGPCGETNIYFLTLDHINGGGNATRSSNWGWAWKHNFPQILRLLCFNCNCAREHNNKICPHIKEGQLLEVRRITPLRLSHPRPLRAQV